MFGRLQDFRRVATRYDKLARKFFAGLGLCPAALLCYWIYKAMFLHPNKNRQESQPWKNGKSWSANTS